jgi:hypothetical protein
MPPSQSSVYIEEYSAKSFVVRGDTQQYKDTLKNMGGKWGNSFTDKNSGEKFGAWLFWNAKRDELEEWLRNGMNTVTKKIVETTVKNTLKSSDNVFKRLEQLESMIVDVVAVLETIDNKKTQKLKKTEFYLWYKSQMENNCDSDIEEDDTTEPRKRLLINK